LLLIACTPKLYACPGLSLDEAPEIPKDEGKYHKREK
jgi:hypothetical protein